VSRVSVYHSRFFWKIFLTFSAISIVVIAAVGLVIYANLKEHDAAVIDSLAATVSGASIAASFVVLGLSLLLARHVTVPISEIVNVTEALGEGRYDVVVKTLPNDEIGQLGDTVNRISRELNRRIKIISQERAQLSAMLTSLVEGIIAVDDHRNVLFCNQAARDLAFSTDETVRGRPLADLKGFSQLQGIVDDAFSRDAFVRSEMEFEKGKRKIITEVSATKFKGQEASGVIVVLHDITNIRRLERIRRDFVANVSHEIKTPLTSIKGYVETILDHENLGEPETLFRFLSKIDRNVARLESLVHDIISLARIESDEGMIEVVPLDWKPIIHSVLGRHEDALKTKHIKFRTEYPEIPVIVSGDKEAMTQVLENLVSNAVKYTPEGGRITVRLRSDEKFGLMEVEDTGIGIPRKDLDRIFERFYRVDKARSREMGGTGLGLSIVKHLVQGMQGDVAVESEVGVGSLFKVRLALARRANV
jgi:two-component system phosphate regulon sensor histidine kinase PhoR